MSDIEYFSEVEVKFVDKMGSDERIVETARQSTDGAFRGWGTPDKPGDEKLLKYMMDNKHDCYDKQTEVLVHGKGFVPWPKVRPDDLLGQWDAETDSLVYERPEYLISKRYSGRMYKVEHGGVDLLVTPKHSMLVKRIVPVGVPGDKKRQAWGDKWELVRAQDLGDHTMIRYRKHTRRLDGTKVDLGLFPPVRDRLALLRLIGFFIGDGFAGRAKRAGMLNFHLKKKRKISYLRTQVEAIGWTLKVKADGYYNVYADVIGAVFRNFFYASESEKVIPQFLLDLPQEEAQALLDGLKNSDGAVEQGRAWSYSSKYQHIIDQLQLVALHAGEVVQQGKTYPNGIHMCRTMSKMREPVINQKKRGEAKDTSTVFYSGNVYCAKTRTGVLVVRRNGKIVLSGNSVFEFGCLHVQVRAPIFTCRQVMRHRTFSFSEVSGRYCEMKEEVYKPNAWLLQAKKNRQMSSAEALDEEAQASIDAWYEECVKNAYETYHYMLDRGVSREQARMVLPLSQMTHWAMCGDLRAWLAFIALRMHPHAQEEAQSLARQVNAIVAQHWPRTHALFMEKRIG